MRAVIYDNFIEPPYITEVTDPSPRIDGIVVRVIASGICRSDWHGWMGHDKDITPPHVPGHELAGIVEAIGKDVKKWRKGDRVTVPFVAGCGRCDECASGNQQVCSNQFQPGFTAWGSFAEYVAVDYGDVNVVRVPDSIDLETAASLGCRFATSFRAVVDQGGVQPGEWVAIHGCGGVGLSAVMIATAMGARVVAIDVRKDKLAVARRLGAEAFILSASDIDVIETVREITNGGAHVSMDALGSAATCYNSVACLRRRGRHVQVGLMTGDHASAAMPMGLIIAHELQIIGSHGMPAHRYGAMLGLILSGKVSPNQLVESRIALSEAPSALVDMAGFSGSGIKIITDFSN